METEVQVNAMAPHRVHGMHVWGGGGCNPRDCQRIIRAMYPWYAQQVKGGGGAGGRHKIQGIVNRLQGPCIESTDPGQTASVCSTTFNGADFSHFTFPLVVGFPHTWWGGEGEKEPNSQTFWGKNMFVMETYSLWWGTVILRGLNQNCC